MGRTFKQTSRCSWCAGHGWWIRAQEAGKFSVKHSDSLCKKLWYCFDTLDALLSISLGRSVFAFSQFVHASSFFSMKAGTAHRTFECSLALHYVGNPVLIKKMGNVVDSMGTCEIQAPVCPATCQEKIYFVVSRAHWCCAAKSLFMRSCLTRTDLPEDKAVDLESC